MSVATDPLTGLLERHFGYKTFRPLQEDIIRHVLAGNDALVLMPTGGGKSLCYQLPALQLGGLTLVVSPLISLMKDQVDALRQNGVEARFLNSTLAPFEAQEVMHDMESGAIRILYVAPERLAVPAFLDALGRSPVCLIAIDEAHCISQWGHDFRPDYRNLRVLRNELPGVPIIALTATATQRVRDDIVAQLFMENTRTFLSSFNRPNLTYSVRPKRGAVDVLLEMLRDRRDQSVIIYCFSRKDTESIAAELRANGMKAAAYHAGLDPDTRHRAQEAFIRDDVQIITATIAFGMGIDKPDVRLVVHMDLPKTIESYYQETGRAGRDGLPADCVLFYSAGDRRKHEYFINDMADPREQEQAREKLRQVLDFCELDTCRRAYLLRYFGEDWPQDNCQSCDLCLQPRDAVDVSEVAGKILTAVAETGGRFGGQYIVSILLGRFDEKVRMRGHDTLGVFGSADEKSEAELRHVINGLTRKGFLLREAGQYPTLSVTPEGTQWLRERTPLHMSAMQEPLTAAPKRRKAVEGEVPYDATLFEELRQLRKSLAADRNVPPFVIFGDVSLREMAYYLPQSLESFGTITGVGQTKLKEFGELFISVIRRFAQERSLEERPRPESQRRTRSPRSSPGKGATYSETRRLIENRFDLDTIATARNIAAGTVIQHIEQLAKEDQLPDIGHMRPSPEALDDIRRAFVQTGSIALKPVFDHLGGRYSYDTIRLARVFLGREEE